MSPEYITIAVSAIEQLAEAALDSANTQVEIG
ncbi:hypothetical protein Amal_03142 [Acetobacter malorum]|uniref:Uncharacterized protein n=1 Tax=Acetobacter malorum TaxID=178901 RepID=A0A177G5R7_9PROT|nr:hypothetical protein Amal_03142 [Acetobacter malorum]